MLARHNSLPMMRPWKRVAALGILLILLLVVAYLGIGKVNGEHCFHYSENGMRVFCVFDITAESRIRSYDLCVQRAEQVRSGWTRQQVNGTSRKWQVAIERLRSLEMEPVRQYFGNERFWAALEDDRVIYIACWRPTGPDGPETKSGYGLDTIMLLNDTDEVTTIWRGEFRWITEWQPGWGGPMD